MSSQSSMPNRRELTACYDHLGGKVAAALLERMVQLGWVAPESESITTSGLEGLAGWGVETQRLASSDRKLLNICHERFQHQRFDHTGSHLGFLLRQWLDQKGWVVAADGGLHLTAPGRSRLAELGVRWD